MPFVRPGDTFAAEGKWNRRSPLESLNSRSPLLPLSPRVQEIFCELLFYHPLRHSQHVFAYYFNSAVSLGTKKHHIFEILSRVVLFLLSFMVKCIANAMLFSSRSVFVYKTTALLLSGWEHGNSRRRTWAGVSTWKIHKTTAICLPKINKHENKWARNTLFGKLGRRRGQSINCNGNRGAKLDFWRRARSVAKRRSFGWGKLVVSCGNDDHWQYMLPDRNR